MRTLFAVFLLGFISFSLHAQVNPAPGAELNYNQVLFEHPVIREASGYIIQITADTSFARPFTEIRDSFNATIVSNLEFGKSYLWRYCSLVKEKSSAWAGPYSFTILSDPYRINQNIRVHVLQSDSLNNAGGLILVDEFHCIFDRNGKLVWFMPEVKSGFRKDAETYDMNITSAGTITVLTAENGVELNLAGQILWMTPFKANDTLLSQFGTFYNHDFKRLPNNNYMVIGRQLKWKKLPEDYDLYKFPYYLDTATWHPVVLEDGKQAMTMAAGFFLRKETDGIYLLMNMGDITEFDKKDSVVWHWQANDYLKDEDFLPKGTNLLSTIRDQEPRLNGFCVDAQNKFVYASFRNLDRVIKIDKSTGKVVHSWGPKMPSNIEGDGEGFFYKQHAPLIMKNGNIVVFNNADMSARKEPSSVVVFSQPSNNKPSEVLWKFNCMFDSVMFRNKSSRAGSVDILPNNDFLVSMGSVNRVFEVSHDKKVVWNALLEKKSDKDSVWIPRPTYRTHYASSLYPCYYTIETDRDSLSGGHTNFMLTINNVGTEADSYSISVTSSSNHYQHKFNSGDIEKRKRAKIKITPTAKPVPANELKL